MLKLPPALWLAEGVPHSFSCCLFAGVCVRLRLFCPEQFKFALNEFNQIQPKKFKESVEFDKILKTIDKLYSL